MPIKSKKAEQSKKVRAALLKAAQDLFMDRGYANTTTKDIVKRAGVTRGALYYHFRDKAALFQTVFYETNSALRKSVAVFGRTTEGDVWQRLVQAICQAFLDACADPGIQRILFLDGPAVLGWDTWRNWDDGSGLRMMRQNLSILMEQGAIEQQPLEPLVHLVAGALTEAALYIARADNVDTAREEMGRSLERLLNGLQVKPSARIEKNAEG